MGRLIFAAQTSVIAQSRAQAGPATDPATHKVPAAERIARVREQCERLAGLTLEGPLEVAYSVCDLVSGMMQADALRHLRPSKRITRMQEITMTKPPKELKLDATGQGIMVKDVQGDQQCEVSTELDVIRAMTRQDGGRVSRRFAVVQSEKARPIDNYSESQINSGVTIIEECTVDGVDTIAATACSFIKALKKRCQKPELGTYF